MTQDEGITSDIVPYLPIQVEMRGQSDEGLALVDTGYTGSLVVPESWLERNLGEPDSQGFLQLANMSFVTPPVFLGNAVIGDQFHLSDLYITVLGDEFILGRQILDRFELIFDHGQRITLRP